MKTNISNHSFGEDAAGQFNGSLPSPATAAAMAAYVPTPTLPETIRLPKPGHLCAWTGMSRSKLNELILPCEANDHRPPVRSVCLRKRGAVKGCRLIYLASLLSYLEKHAEGGE
jgi:hypothetical protein